MQFVVILSMASPSLPAVADYVVLPAYVGFEPTAHIGILALEPLLTHPSLVANFIRRYQSGFGQPRPISKQSFIAQAPGLAQPAALPAQTR